MESEEEREGLDISCLSDREVTIVELAALGAADRRIARELGTQMPTLGRYWTRIRMKMRVESRTEAVAKYARAKAHRIVQVNEQLEREVGELRLALERLSVTADLQGNVLDLVGEGVAITDQAGLVTFSNARFASMLDKRAADVVGRSLFDLVGPAEGSALRRKLEHHTHGSPADHEVDFVLDDGRRRHLRISAIASPDPAGEPCSIVVTISDVTQRKRLETALQKALEQSEERRRHLEAVLEILPIGVALFAPGGEIVRANRQMRALWGARIARLPTSDEIEAMDCRWSSSGELLTKGEWITTRVLGGKETVANMDVTMATTEGNRRRVLSSAAAIHGEDGAVTGAIVASVEMTCAFSGDVADDKRAPGLDAQIARLVEIVESLGGEALGRVDPGVSDQGASVEGANERQ